MRAKKFIKGDKVKVYGHVANAGTYMGYARGSAAKVTEVLNESEILIRFDVEFGSLVPGRVCEVHPKQCRRIKK